MTTQRTAIRQLIDRLQGATSVEKAEKAFFDMLELERQIIAGAYEAALSDINQDVKISCLEYYDKIFDNQ
jgi:hypothetical protein